jgi:hypothetical protein
MAQVSPVFLSLTLFMPSEDFYYDMSIAHIKSEGNNQPGSLVSTGDLKQDSYKLAIEQYTTYKGLKKFQVTARHITYNFCRGG